MKNINCAILALAFPLLSTAGENLIKNGDFSKGSSRWKGDENIEFETPAEKNKICKIIVDEDDDIEFFQSISSTSKYKDLMLKFRVKKSDNYKGRGYQVRFIRSDGSYTYMTRPLPKNSDWKDMEIKFSDLKKSSRIDLKFIIRSGDSGYLAFDDITVIGEK
jgi:hypothetical protein